MEIAGEIHERCGRTGLNCVRVEVAYVSERRGDENQLPEYDAQHEIDEQMVERVRDRFNYRKDLDQGEVDAFLKSLNR